MTADVAILIGKKEDALLIPLSAISSGQVIKLNGRKREKMAVKLGVVDGELGEVISGNISVNDKLLVRKK